MELQHYDGYGSATGESEIIPNDADRERTISIHQQQLYEQTYATFTTSTPSELLVSVDVPCHATFKLMEDATYYSSCFDQSWMGSHPAGDAYYDWMTSDSSPWRTLFKYGKPERILPNKNGQGGGFILDAKIGRELKSKWPIYNFMVAMRMVSEEVDSIKTWHTLVDLGLHPADALYLSRMYLLQNYQGSVYLSKYGLNDGSHWPLSNSECAYSADSLVVHSFERFRNGVMANSNSSSGIWWDTSKEARPPFVLKIESDVERSAQKFYAPIRVIDAFKEYLKGKP